MAFADEARVGDHLRRFFGSEGSVFHELVSDRIHLDVYMVPSTKEHPFRVLVTSGMSALPMRVPAATPDREDWQFGELCILLPPTWDLSDEGLQEERWYWPVRLLKTIARLPNSQDTWLGPGHSIPHGDPAEPYIAGSELSGVVLIPPFVLGRDFFEVPGSPALHIFQLLPVTTAEMSLKLRSGTDALLELLESAAGDPYGPIDPGRKSAL